MDFFYEKILKKPISFLTKCKKCVTMYAQCYTMFSVNDAYLNFLFRKSGMNPAKYCIFCCVSTQT